MAREIPTVQEIIAKAGGPRVIAEASGGVIGVEAPYKWPKIGIPDRHWPLVMRLSGATADELLKANMAARGASAPAGAAA